MYCPTPKHQPDFPREFVDEAKSLSRQSAVEHRHWQRARMVVLINEEPTRSCPEIGEEVGLDKTSVRRWKKRWASGDFSLEDRNGRCRKPKVDGL